MMNEKLVYHLRQYVGASTEDYVDIERFCSYLKENVREFRRQKTNSLVATARSAYQTIAHEFDKPVFLETKKSRHGQSIVEQNQTPEITLDCDDLFIEEASGANSNYVAYEDTNSMNNTMINLYSNNTVKTEPAAESSSGAGSSRTALESNSVTPTDIKLNGLANKPEGAETSVASEIIGLSKSQSTAQKKRKLDIAHMWDFKKRQNETQKDILKLDYSTTRFSDIGGCESHLLEICKLVMHMKHPELFKRLGVKPPRGFLLHGPPGCGKTMMAHAVAGELDLPFIKIAATEIVSGVSGDSEQRLRDLFAQAVAFAPSILFLDEIDAIAPRRDTAQREMERRIVAQLYTCLDDLDKADKPVMVIGATSRPDSIDPGLRRAGRFDKEIGLGMPDEKSRERILEIVCRNVTLEPTFNLKMLARLTPGYVGADLSALAREACIFSINRVFRNIFGRENDAEWKIKLNLEEATKWLREKAPLDYDKLDDLDVKMDDFKKALKLITPSAKREGFATVPDVTWDDVGALVSVREALKWSILYPIKHPEAFDSLGLSTKPQGILLCGPPGCGKTLIAKAVANESGMNFISVKGPELLSMYVGESERAVRQVFQRAINSAPCVIFFDELDALCPRRSENESGGSARVVNQLLTEMDGIESRKMVFLIGATNRPDIIDPAIMRPGRLDKVLYVGFPDIDDKVDIFSAITKNRTRPSISTECDFTVLAGDPRSQYFSGADLAALVHEAAVLALKENLSNMLGVGSCLDEITVASKTETKTTVRPTVSMRHFEEAFQIVRPSVSEKERETYEKLRLKYDVKRV